LLDVSGCTKLQELNCEGNQLKFSTLILPPRFNGELEFGYQEDLSISLVSGCIVDLSSETHGGTTSFLWYFRDGTQVHPSLYTSSNGVFNFTGLQKGDVIFCVMVNLSYGNAFNSEDEEGWGYGYYDMEEHEWTTLRLRTTEVMITQKQPEQSYELKISNKTTKTEAKDTLNAIKVDKKDKTAVDYNQVTLTLPPEIIKKAVDKTGYTHILIDIWGAKTKINGKSQLPLWATITLEIKDGKVTGVSSGSVLFFARVNEAGTAMVLSGFDAGTKYSLRVYAVTLNEDGKFDENSKASKALSVNITTKKYTAIKSLKAPKTATANTIDLAWDTTTTNSEYGEGYNIYWLDGKDLKPVSAIAEGVKIETRAPGERTAKITGLNENTKYTFIVQAFATVNNEVIESVTAKVSAKTAKPAKA